MNFSTDELVTDTTTVITTITFTIATLRFICFCYSEQATTRFEYRDVTGSCVTVRHSSVYRPFLVSRQHISATEQRIARLLKAAERVFPTRRKTDEDPIAENKQSEIIERCNEQRVI
ncbi:MAG: hypothetical protein JW863_21200 [Chitinispirillaceae bacterium]|nr:hypothetical protein [Chitinispirillaceae bacterium]